MTDHEIINKMTARLIKQFGRDIAALPFEQQMIVIEGVAAGLIGFSAIRFNKQPNELADAFCQGVRERLNRAIYGRPQ